MASFNKSGDPNKVTADYAVKMMNTAQNGSYYISTEYVTVYDNEETTYQDDLMYTVGKTGDSTKEVYTGIILNQKTYINKNHNRNIKNLL